MKFVDQVTVEVIAGNGGSGCCAFRREKFLPLGGPSGGDGGDGGSVILEAHSRLSTLLDLKYRRKLTAENGEPGRGKDQYGAAGKDVVFQVPVGTQIYDDESGELLVDLDEAGKTHVVAQGGDGGRGNIHFATPWDRAPRRSDPGTPGEAHKLRLELKSMADVGVVGFPNVGKSTFIASVSRARPKIADYPFTTLAPNLCVASLGEGRSFVIADIPGIIEGASEGAGLGLRFLRHVERTKVLLHVITFDPDPERSPLQDFDKLIVEMDRFHEGLGSRPSIVGISKSDLPDVQEQVEEIRAALEPRGYEVLVFSSATHQGLDEVLLALERVLKAERPEDEEPETSRPTAADRPHGHATPVVDE